MYEYTVCTQHVCSIVKTRSEERTKRSDGAMEGDHLRFNLAILGQSSQRTERSLGVSRLSAIWPSPKLVGYQTGGVRGHVCAPMQVTDALQPPRPLQAGSWVVTTRTSTRNQVIW